MYLPNYNIIYYILYIMSEDIPRIQILPIPGEKFTGNTLDVTTPINDNDYKFEHTGTYIASSSSYSNDKCIAANAFNVISDTFWQCDYANNPDYNIHTFAYKKPYANSPYIKSADGPSIYQPIGGGSITTKWLTLVGKKGNQKNIAGEWLQIKIPEKYPVFLYKYSILTPPPINGVITFPKSFVLVGSMDGILWDYIDQQSMKNEIDTSKRIPTVFNINCEHKFCYFRLIITSLFQQNDNIKINQFALYGTPVATINRDAFTEMSHSLVQSLPADSLHKYANYSNSIVADTYSGPGPELFRGYTEATMNSIKHHEVADPNGYDDSIYMYILIPILATCILLYNFD